MINSKPQIGKVKNLIQEKLTVVDNPEHGNEIVIVRELALGPKHTIDLGIGKCWRYKGYWELVGYVYNDERNEFRQGNIRVERKLPKSTKVLCGQTKREFFEMVDKAALGFSGEQWSGNIDDFIALFEKFYAN